MQFLSRLKQVLANRPVLLLLAVGCLALGYFTGKNEPADIESFARAFEKTLHQKEEHAKKELLELAEKSNQRSYKEIFSEKPEYYERLLESEGLVFLIFEEDTLRFWTDNTIAVNQYLPNNDFSGKIARLPNGWFGIEKHTDGQRQFFGLILLRREYAYQNRYLGNSFQRDFNLRDEATLSVETARASQTDRIRPGDIFEKKGHYLCTLDFPAETVFSSFSFYLSILLNAFGLLFILALLQWEVDSLKDKIGRGWAILLLTVTLLILRYLTLMVRFPEVFYESDLFGPELYGDATWSWLGSLGDLMINALILFYIVYYIRRNLSPSPVASGLFGGKREVTGRGFLPFIFLLGLFQASGIINYVFSGIISNSHIPFTINDLFSQDRYTYMALFIIGIFFAAYFLLLDKITDFLEAVPFKGRSFYLATGSVIVLHLAVSFLLGTQDLILVGWPVVLFMFILWTRNRKTGYSFSVIVILLFIVSFYSAHVVLKYSQRKERESRMIYAEKLSAEQDPLAEHLFMESEISISMDTALQHVLREPDRQKRTSEYSRLLVTKYFSGYWEKYEVRVSVYDTACLPLVQGSLPDRDNLAYFENRIAADGIASGSNNFYYLQNSSGKISYLARVPIIRTSDLYSFRMGDLFIEFDSRIISEENGFPELMLDRKLGITHDLMEYSYARYKNGAMVNYHGKYAYSFSSELFYSDSAATASYPRHQFLVQDGYHHLLYSPDPENLVVISRPNNGLTEMVTTFSYLFAYFSLVLLALLIIRFMVFDRQLKTDSFRSRLQYVLVSMVLFSLLFFGGGTVYYIKQQYERQTRQSVRDKMLSAVVEGMQELGEESELSPTKSDYFSFVLRRMSSIFLTDISLYDAEGNLAGSSQMKLFEEGLLSRKMSPESFYRLAIRGQIEHIQNETIGNLEYLSAYCAFRNEEGDLLGYLNIPYFARQSELEKEISVILSAIINIYVLLFVISVILALAISEYFTAPLKLIRQKLSQIKLGKANEPIEWKSDDEIGGLVNEYNRMIEELQKSAVLLARSERETAWREMAKQVAHEIKNPLTPMKLSIQHLQRTWKNKDDDRDQKIERITATLIEQIDALSTIASEFSSFAKMPSGVSEKVDMRNVVENCIALFKESSDTEIVFNGFADEAFVYADKEQLIRVCNNLLKNAMQAIPEDRKGRIEVSLMQIDGQLLMKIRDNGTGIAEDAMSKIFTPNFTTKSAGMGLGLAMVKSIVETFGGRIWFETSKGSGTTFFVSLPEYSN